VKKRKTRSLAKKIAGKRALVGGLAKHIRKREDYQQEGAVLYRVSKKGKNRSEGDLDQTDREVKGLDVGHLNREGHAPSTNGSFSRQEGGILHLRENRGEEGGPKALGRRKV